MADDIRKIAANEEVAEDFISRALGGGVCYVLDRRTVYDYIKKGFQPALYIKPRIITPFVDYDLKEWILYPLSHEPIASELYKMRHPLPKKSVADLMAILNGEKSMPSNESVHDLAYSYYSKSYGYAITSAEWQWIGNMVTGLQLIPPRPAQLNKSDQMLIHSLVSDYNF